MPEPTALVKRVTMPDVLDEQPQLVRRDSGVAAIRLTSMDDVYRFATTALGSSMIPKSYRDKSGKVKLEDVVMAVQMGSELGLPPMQSILNIAVIQGRPSVWGDAMPGLCRSSGRCEYIKEWFTGEGDTLTAWCEAKRKDDPNPVTQAFSVQDAKTAKLWNKKGYDGGDTPWVTNPRRMLQNRARGFALRDGFPDVLRGLISAEEAMDFPAEPYTGITLDQQSQVSDQPQTSQTSSPQSTPHAGQPAGGPPTSGQPTSQSQQTFLDHALAALANEPNGTRWLKLLGELLTEAKTIAEIAEMRACGPVKTALAKAPSLIKAQIDDFFRQATDRVSPKWDDGPEHQPEGGDEPKAELGEGTGEAGASKTES